MASRLMNLNRTLTWSDFGRPRTVAAPAAGVKATIAQCRTTYRETINFDGIKGTRTLKLRDDVVIEVVLDSRNTFVNAWLFDRPQDFQDATLHHEQGHYDLVALFCRDMFYEYIAVLPQTFANVKAAAAATPPIKRRFDKLIAGVHKAYDDDTEHGLNADRQKIWDGFIQSALTKDRSPAASAPDGTALKTPLADVLTAGGVTI